jgi:hypothetical protein
MRFYTALIVALFVASAAAKCLDGSDGKAEENTECSWYNEKSCCSKAFSDALEKSIEAQKEFADKNKCTIDQGCIDQVTLFACGSACSPDFSEAISKGKLNICASFADKLYSSCKDSQIAPVSTSDCGKTVGELYSDSKAMVEKMFGANYDEADSAPACFNAGSIAQPALAVILFAVAALLKF